MHPQVAAEMATGVRSALAVDGAPPTSGCPRQGWPVRTRKTASPSAPCSSASHGAPRPYLTNALESFLYKGSLMRNDADNKIFLEQLLLIKGWRKYTWQDIAANASAANPVIDSLQFKGKITINKKALKKPVVLNLKNFVTPKFSELQLINTDSTGNFKLLAEKISSEPDRKFEITVRNDRPKNIPLHLAIHIKQ